MGALWSISVYVLHVAAACGAIVLALWLASQRNSSQPPIICASLALGFSAVWAIATSGPGPESELGQFLVSFSYLAWLGMLYSLFATDERDKSVGPVRPVAAALAFVELLQIALTAARLHYSGEPEAQELILPFAIMFRLLFCTGALVLVHNLYAGASPAARQNLRWAAAAMATLWLYDLNLYTIAYLSADTPEVLFELRTLALVVAVGLLAFGTMRSEREMRFQPSRSFAFRSFSLLIIGSYLVIMVMIAQGLAYAGSDFGRFLQIGFVVLASAIALTLLPSRKMRSLLRVTIAKHLFQHRYDYRAEWLRFTDTIGRAGSQSAPLRERAVQAVADVTDSPCGLLLTPREDGGMAVDARWQWPDIAVPALAMEADGVRFFEESQFILDLDDLRSGRAQGIPAAASPQWLLDDQEAWALVPLLHFERLVGIVVLSRAPAARMLDWEDFDLLRVIGRQLASYLAEQSSQDALGEAQRFDEFNRRIAFVMHDIKNLASQLSLLARNAEKHAEKPEFRADMLLTLRNSTDKLQALLARLGRYGGQGGGANVQIDLNQVIQRVVGQYKGKHELVAVERSACHVMGDAEALEQALVHLVHNAIEASNAGTPVFLDLRQDGTNVIVEVVDSGCGMSPEFVRTKLFKPFHSSKQGGFGIGAFEARELVRAMGGRLDVESREGMGTRFLLRFPLARTSGMMQSLPRSEQNSDVERANG
ncbi:PEP-CTERM system histidine kinase PrsK [Alteraurantiacibacter aestuarii]|uniref:XrtA/PEP-CTERM system histidine kinase PrsK n=1 Tax=Alteraurantiacibacter aestuarii TaxID=650004 RepID=UPI0031DDE49C